MNWKWLFIYPQQHIATINFVEFPEKTPIILQLTADAPMNSLWIPQLGGQMYAMTGMQTQLHLLADNVGDYPGSEVEINGPGYTTMRFIARVSTQENFDRWTDLLHHSPNILTFETYQKLSEPSQNNPIVFYSSVEKDLYNSIIMKYMTPQDQLSTISPTLPEIQKMDSMPGM